MLHFSNITKNSQVNILFWSGVPLWGVARATASGEFDLVPRGETIFCFNWSPQHKFDSNDRDCQ
jgi:hypothetical protein